MKTLGEILDSLDYTYRSFDKKRTDGGLWHSPASRIPVQWTKVQVITCDGKMKIAKFLVDNNWKVPGFPHDAFNRDIALWRYIDNP